MSSENKNWWVHSPRGEGARGSFANLTGAELAASASYLISTSLAGLSNRELFFLCNSGCTPTEHYIHTGMVGLVARQMSLGVHTTNTPSSQSLSLSPIPPMRSWSLAASGNKTAICLRAEMSPREHGRYDPQRDWPSEQLSASVRPSLPSRASAVS